MEENGFASRNLSALYEEAILMYARLQKSYSQELFDTCNHMLKECEERTRTLALFSWNETLEDLGTSSLRYILVDFYLGMLSHLLHTTDIIVRQQSLEESLKRLQVFIKRVVAYELLDEESKRLIQPLETFGSVRNGKIARQQGVKSYLAQTQIASQIEGEEGRRERHLCEIRGRTIEAQTEIEAIRMELEVISQKSAIEAPDFQQPAKYPSVTGPSVASRVTQPFILLSSRQQISDRVFKPGHCLPTMTIDEYLELERKRGGIIANDSIKDEPENDEDRDEFVDRRTMKDRQFDLFVDDNPRGWGNTRNLG